ncbi:MAG: hypothetical protein BWY79_01245 [Actinobacteria bacterium ADurb.Bin444]|nr:MAG: hypothetical protein BWY79_01245 [Actinobacteria bacterium ADurb.Bin444]
MGGHLLIKAVERRAKARYRFRRVVRVGKAEHGVAVPGRPQTPKGIQRYRAQQTRVPRQCLQIFRRRIGDESGPRPL